MRLQKTVIIGLGGTGYGVVKRTKKLLLDVLSADPEFKIAQSPIRFCVLDFDSQGEDHAPLDKEEFKPIDGERARKDLGDALSSTATDGFWPRMAAWAHREAPGAFQAGMAGAAQTRMLGRLLYMRKGLDIKTQIENAQKFENPAELHPRAEAGVRFILVGSFSGGTGSGLILDVASLIRAGLPGQEVDIAAFVPTRSVFASYDVNQRTFKNFYATLKELSAMNSGHSSGLLSTYEPWGTKRPYQLGIHGARRGAPIDRCFFFDDALAKKVVGGELGKTRLYEYMAASVFAYAMTASDADEKQFFSAPANAGLLADQDRLAAQIGASMLVLPSVSDAQKYLRARICADAIPAAALPKTIVESRRSRAASELATVLRVDPTPMNELQLTLAADVPANSASEEQTRFFRRAVKKFLKDRRAQDTTEARLFPENLLHIFAGTKEAAGIAGPEFPIKGTIEAAAVSALKELRSSIDDFTSRGGVLTRSAHLAVVIELLSGAARMLEQELIVDLALRFTRERTQELKELIASERADYAKWGFGIKSDVYDRFSDRVATCIVEGEPRLWSDLRIQRHRAAELRTIIDELLSKQVALDGVISALSAADQDATDALNALRKSDDWDSVHEMRDVESPIMHLTRFSAFGSELFRLWLEERGIDAIGPRMIVDEVERAWQEHSRKIARSGELKSKEEWLEALRRFSDERVGDVQRVLDRAVARFLDGSLATATLGLAGNLGSLGNSVEASANRGCLVLGDARFRDDVTNIPARWDQVPTTYTVDTELNFGGRSAVLLVYYQTNDSLRNVVGVETALSSYRAVLPEEPTEFWHLDRAFASPGVPELAELRTVGIQCHNCGHALNAQYPARDVTHACPVCSSPIRIWCGNKDCGHIESDTRAVGEPLCRACRRLRIASFFECVKHGSPKYFAKERHDVCPDCVNANVVPPTSWKGKGAGTVECQGCQASGVRTPRIFSGEVAALLDGIDDDVEAADAERSWNDGLNFTRGACTTCGTAMLPTCAYGPADLATPERVHYPRRTVVSGVSIFSCTKDHFDASGAVVRHPLTYACTVCSMPIREPKGRDAERCARCGTEHFACAWHNSQGYAKPGGTAFVTSRRLLTLADLGGARPDADTSCPICKLALSQAFDVAPPSPPPPPPPPPAVRKKCAACSLELKADPGLKICPRDGGALIDVAATP